MSTVSNKLLIYFFGLRRSGNHTILTWLHDLCQNCRSEHFNNQKVGKPLKWQPKTNPRRDLVTISYEDTDPLVSRDPLPKVSNYIGESEYVLYINIIRDPLNLFASRYKHHSLKVETMRRTDYYIRLWANYARFYIENAEPDVINISYNHWLKSSEYRHSIAYMLGYESFDEIGMQKVPKRTGGSSFDGRSYEGNATAMDVNNRYKLMTKSRAYHQFIKRLTQNKYAIECARYIYRRCRRKPLPLW